GRGAEVIFLAGSPRRAPAPASAAALSDWLFSLVPPGCFPPPSGPLLLPRHRRCGCRCTAARRLLDYFQPQLAGLPPQRLELLLLHLRLVLLLTLTHICHPVLQPQIHHPSHLLPRPRHAPLSP